MRKKHIPDHARRIAGHTLLLTILITGPACDRSGTRNPPAETRSVPQGVVNAAPHFISGGAPGNIAIACGSIIRRLDTVGEQIVSDTLAPHDYLAIYLDPAGKASRFVVRTQGGPVLLEQNEARTLPGWPGDANAEAVAFSPDGGMLAAAPSPGPDQKTPPALIVWKFPLEAYMAIPADEIGTVSLIAWSADGHSLLVADSTNTLSIFRPPRRKAVFTQKVDPGVEGKITAIDLSPDGDWFLVAANAIRIRAWQLPFMNAQLKAWGRVDRVFFAGHVGEVVTVDAANVAIHWLVNYGNVVADTTHSLGELQTVGVPAGGNSFFVLGTDGTIRGYRSGDLKLLGEVEGVSCLPAKKDSLAD